MLRRRNPARPGISSLTPPLPTSVGGGDPSCQSVLVGETFAADLEMKRAALTGLVTRRVKSGRLPLEQPDSAEGSRCDPAALRFKPIRTHDVGPLGSEPLARSERQPREDAGIQRGFSFVLDGLDEIVLR